MPSGPWTSLVTSTSLLGRHPERFVEGPVLFDFASPLDWAETVRACMFMIVSDFHGLTIFSPRWRSDRPAEPG